MKPQKQTKSQIKTIPLVLILAGLSMGNKGCDDAKEKPRVLRMDVEIGTIHARPVHLPTGEVIDFAYAANTLFYRQVMNDDHFVITNAVPSPTSLMGVATHASVSAHSSSSNSTSRNYELSSDVSHQDQVVLERFGFMRQLEKKATTLSYHASEFSTSASQAEYQQLPACLYDMPQAQLGGEVISFEATWGAGIGVGYGNDGSSLPGNASGKVNFSRSRLEIGLRADDPLTHNTVAIADGVAHQEKVKFGVRFIPGIPIGLDFFFNTPLSNVIRTSMDRGLDKIVDSYKKMMSLTGKWDEVWESRVVYDPIVVDNDTHIAFRSGYRANVQVGDTFTVTNLHYVWEGSPCETRLKYKIPLTTSPVAEVEVISVGDNVAVAQVKQYLLDQRIKPGAQVKILKLKEPPKKKSKKK